MKVAIITRHAASNYGSLLQSIATQYILKKFGYDNEIINYIRKDEYGANSTFTVAKSTPKWSKNIFMFLLYVILRYPENLYVSKKFEKMRKKYLKMTKLYLNSEDLEMDKPKADIYMTGSDQVWGNLLYGGYDWNYFLKFCDDRDKKIAFSSSFGKTNVSSELDKRNMIDLLRKYSCISVRENQAVSLLKDWGLNSEQVLDPTLLLSAKEWNDLLDLDNCSKKKKYILIYQIHNDREVGEYAEKVAKKLNLPLLRVSAMLHQINQPGKLILTPELREFVSYLKQASYLVTDSFHGTVFALNFNIPFVDIIPKTGTGSRIESILKLTNLENRIVSDIDNLNILDKEIDFKYSNKVLKEEREKSICILTKMLEDFNGVKNGRN